LKAFPWPDEGSPLLIAEVGGNHEGSFDSAQRLCDLAIDSGANYIKFQVYTGDSLVSPVESLDRNKHFRRFELSPEQHVALAEQCRSAGVGYAASVWDPDMLEWIDEYLDFYKIGSGDLTAWPVLERFAERGKPILLSTGLSSLAETLETIVFLEQCNPVYRDLGMIALMQCTAMYPIGSGDANLRVMDTLREATGRPVGYSDHTRGMQALTLAAARDAQVLEFHFTDSREGKTFRDHKVSLTGDEVKELRGRLDQIAELLGTSEKQPLRCEIEPGHVTSFRRGLYSRVDLRAGDEIRPEHLVALRPNHGIDARRYREIVGKRVKHDTRAYAALEVDE